MYGYEVVLDLKNANTTKFTREALSEFLDKLCLKILKVRPEVRYFWDDKEVPLEEQQIDPKTKGTTVIQFLLFSNVTVHTLDLLQTVYINIFVCRKFDVLEAIAFCKEFFDADIIKTTVLERL